MYKELCPVQKAGWRQRTEIVGGGRDDGHIYVSRRLIQYKRKHLWCKRGRTRLLEQTSSRQERLASSVQMEGLVQKGAQPVHQHHGQECSSTDEHAGGSAILTLPCSHKIGKEVTNWEWMETEERDHCLLSNEFSHYVPNERMKGEVKLTSKYCKVSVLRIYLKLGFLNIKWLHASPTTSFCPITCKEQTHSEDGKGKSSCYATQLTLWLPFLLGFLYISNIV